MPRSKVKNEFIADDNARRTSFRKRKPSLMKKMDEICTLCDVEACVIMHSPYAVGQLELWPDQNGVQKVVDRFMSVPNIDQNKKMLNQEDYLMKRISKAKEQLKKNVRENREKHIAKLKSECLGDRGLLAKLNLNDLNDLVSFAKDHILQIEAMLELRKSGVPPKAPPHSPEQQQQVVVGGSNTTEWFTDWSDNMEEHVMMTLADNLNRLGSGPSSPKA